MNSLESLASFWCDLAVVLQQKHRATWLSQRDLHLVKKARSREESEWFLTTHLPALAKDVYASFKVGYLKVTSRFKLKRGRALPEFLYGLFSLIYHEDGQLKDPSIVEPEYIHVLLQLLGMYYKLESKEIPEVGKTIAMEKFLATQERISNQVPFNKRGLEPGHVLNSARKMIWQLLEGRREGDLSLDPLSIVPRHGSGATACKTKQHQKWNIPMRENPNMNKVFPFDEYFVLSASVFSDTEFMYCSCSHKKYGNYEQVARVTYVPKNAEGPRLISMEPRENQWIQQGLMRALYSYIERHPATAGRVNFTNQTINNRLAKEGSMFGNLATLDLKEASDSVSLELVKYLFPPRWVEALLATRSHSTIFPNGEKTVLESFAPMGSALCFPVEALVFWAIAQSAAALGSKGPVYVYGDDIICNTQDVDIIIQQLSECDLIVNTSKSYYSGLFRESCGRDYFAGHDVTVKRMRQLLEKGNTNLIANVQFVNQIAEAFGVKTALKLVDTVERIHGVIPQVPGSEEPTFFSFGSSQRNFSEFRNRYNEKLQCYETRVRVVKTTKFQTGQDGWGEATRNIVGRDCLLKRGEYVKDRSMKIGWGWRSLSDNAFDNWVYLNSERSFAHKGFPKRVTRLRRLGTM